MELTSEKSKFGDGHFVRLTKNNRYICFSPNVWTKLMKEIDVIAEALRNDKAMECRLTKESIVETQIFQGKTYVCFKKNGLYINLDQSQWDQFRNKAAGILSSEDKENVSPKPSIVRYLYVTEHCPPKSFFSKTHLKEHAEAEGLPYRVTEKQVPAPEKEMLIRLVRAYLTKKKLTDIVRENCYGCQYDMPSQRDHICLEEDAEDSFKH